uniref:Uncharacterized protein n=1 Tax=Arundo donax TaxID=35708 RepID=A0A0A8YQN8_ARUDO
MRSSPSSMSTLELLSSCCPTEMIEFLRRGMYTSLSSLCSPCLPLKMIVPHPWMLTTDPSLNQPDPVTTRSSSEKISARPVMWFVAPVSRYQPSRRSASSVTPRNT